jgi:curli biogenesis system outer membrane secretion channel CsgG
MAEKHQSTNLPENMKRNLLWFACGLVLMAGGAANLVAEDEGLPSLIVAPFSGNTTAITYWQPAMGEGLSEMLITEMGKLNKFTVLETTQLETLKDEIKMGDDGWVEQSEKVDKGGFAAADFMFTAKVTRFGNKETNVGLGGFVPGALGGLGVHQTTADVRIDWRLVDASNRKILKTGSSTAAQKGGGFTLGAGVNGNGGGIGFNNHEFMDSALGKATVKALAQITADLAPVPLPESGRHKKKAAMAGKDAATATAAAEGLRATPGKVLAVANKDTIIVSLGSKNGFKAGDKLNLYEVTEVKDDKGAVVFADEKLVGEVTIQSTQDEKSKVSYAGDNEVKPGWIVKAK